VPAVATPPSELSLVPDAVPSLVAETSALLYYPLLQHVFHTATSGNSSGASVEPTAAILLRAQTSPDVDVPCSDSTFVSYDGRTWQPTVPESGTSKYGPHVQKRLCYAYPPSISGRSDSALCLPYARDAARDGPSAPLTADFAGTVWRLNSTTGGLMLAPVGGTVDAVVVKFTDPHMVLGSRRYTDGNVVPVADGGGWLCTLYATPGVHSRGP
jgi:hypothetical protein